MAASTSARPVTVTANAGVSSLIQRTLAAVIAWNDSRVTRKSLGRLTDRELDDIGLVRGDIENI
ncbi:DUF1127 domain-containing protein [Oceaniglobus roseus]|uniref:DUF1127 domain-containing protein n=1 Tax=Oceaniglobus roseus TaxID=1737570 RepID=UPI000C7E8F87|nr:DUF1127 domain-containing protein [Kandeliimicrobium roseum]